MFLNVLGALLCLNLEVVRFEERHLGQFMLTTLTFSQLGSNVLNQSKSVVNARLKQERRARWSRVHATNSRDCQ